MSNTPKKPNLFSKEYRTSEQGKKTIQTGLNVLLNADATLDMIGSLHGDNSSTSIARLSKDLIFNMPVVSTKGIPYDELYPIVKGIEKNFAILFFAAIVAEGVIDRDETKSIKEFLKKFHTNIDLPFDSMESFNEAIELAVEAVVHTNTSMNEVDVHKTFSSIMDYVNPNKINDLCKPFSNPSAKLESALEAAKTSEERRFEEKFFKKVNYATTKKGAVRTSDGGNVVDSKNPYSYITPSSDPDVYADQVAKYGEPETLARWDQLSPQSMSRYSTRGKETLADRKYQEALKKEERAYKEDMKATDRQYDEAMKMEERIYREGQLDRTHIDGDILKDGAFSAMSPTVLKIGLANTKSGSSAWTHNFFIGIRASMKLLKSNILVSNMVEAYKNRAIFKFIRFTNKETNFLDFLFGVSKSRDYVSSGSRWVKFLRNLSKKRNVSKKAHPITSIIITDAEAYEIKRLCGVDPRDPKHTATMMDSHNILSFCIYDMEEKMVHIMMDGEKAFTTMSLRTMIADVNKQLTLDSTR